MASLIRDGVREEVKEAVKQVDERLLVQEKDSQQLKSQMHAVVTDLASLKEEIQSNKDSPPIAQTDMKDQVQRLSQELQYMRSRMHSLVEPARPPRPDNIQQGYATAVKQGVVAVHEVPVVGGQVQDLDHLVSEARRTIGLYRIDQADLQRMRQEQYGGAKTPEEEKILAVKEYLKGELKIDSLSIERMKIEKTFYLSEKKEILFVTFQHRSSVSKVFDKTYIMRKESRIHNYIPRQFRDRARAISEIEFNIREVEKCKTKVKMGFKDLQLFKKERGGKWVHVELPEAELPPVDLGPGSSPSRTGTASPPPGRPCQSRTEKRLRESSGSPNGSQPKITRKAADSIVTTPTQPSDATAKNAWKAADTIVTTPTQPSDATPSDWSKVVGEADLVTEGSNVSPAGRGFTRQPDIGRVLSISGTPAKTSQALNTEYMNSPVFSRQNKS